MLDALRTRGAMFHSELRTATDRLPVEVEEGLWDLVARGIVTADGFQAVRSLLSARQAWKRRQRHEQRLPAPGPGAPRHGARRRGAVGAAAHAGPDDDIGQGDARRAGGRAAAGRAGASSSGISWPARRLALPWREVVWALRRLEGPRPRPRGPVRDGASAGEQYALPEAVEELRGCAARNERADRAAQRGRPAQPGGDHPARTRVTAVRTNSVAYRDGLPVCRQTRRRTPEGPGRAWSTPTSA